MVNVFTIIQILGICVIFIAMVLLITDDNGTREQKLMCYFLCGSLVQNVGYLLEVLAPGMEAAILSIKIQYLGSIFVPLCYCMFMYSYCYEKPPVKLFHFLGVVDFILLVMIFSLDWHTLYYRKIDWLAAADGHSYLSLTYGPGYPVFMICSCILPFALSMSALIRATIKDPERAETKKYKMIIFFSTFPMFALLVYIGKLTQPFDYTPVVLGLSLSLVVILIWRRRTFDFRRMAAETLLACMGDGVLALDLQQRILTYNQAAVNIFPNLVNYKAGDRVTARGDIPGDMLQENANREFTVEGRFYESHTKLILDSEGRMQGYLILFLDVTDTKNYIEEIKTVREQAEQANVAKSEFLANMSHEIRTPMNAIIGLSDIIIEESQGERLTSYAKDIKSSSQNLLVIINDILDLSKVEAGKMELVYTEYYIKTIVDEVIHMMEIAASKKGLDLQYEYYEKLPCGYYGDQGRIKQILINLLNNAIKFTNEGYVKIYIGGQQGETEDKEILVFTVEDTGCGIRPEDQEKIFDNFKQVDSKKNRSVEGTGLGLSITKHLVQLMSGTIELESSYGEGSVFTVTIPQKITDRRALTESPEDTSVAAEKIEVFVAEDFKVLVVDDNLINRKVAKGFLDTYQFELAEAESGQGAIDLVKDCKYDIIFMDHMMPEMDGIEAVRIIRSECGENGTEPVVIALTANAMEGVREKFLKNGFDDFLPKPLDRKRLNEMLLKWVPVDRRKEKTMADIAADAKERESEFDKIDIEGIDKEAAQRYQSGSIENYVELLQLYCMDGRRKIELLDQLYEDKNYQAYEIEVHALKSASANIGAMRLSAEAREHEEAALKGDTEYISRHFNELLDHYERQLACIQAFIEEREQQAEDAKEKLPEFTKEELTRKVEEALEQLENFHSRECAAIVEDLLRHRMDSDISAGLRDVKKQLKLYEDELAEGLLRALTEKLKN